MSLQDDNKAVVGRWFTDFWGKTCNLGVVDEIAAPDMLLKYSLPLLSGVFRTNHPEIFDL